MRDDEETALPSILHIHRASSSIRLSARTGAVVSGPESRHPPHELGVRDMTDRIGLLGVRGVIN